MPMQYSNEPPVHYNFTKVNPIFLYPPIGVVTTGTQGGNLSMQGLGF